MLLKSELTGVLVHKIASVAFFCFVGGGGGGARFPATPKCQRRPLRFVANKGLGEL